MAAITEVREGAKEKRSFVHAPPTLGCTNTSPSKKQAKTTRDGMQNLQPEILEALTSVLDEKLDEFTTRLSAMMDEKIADLQEKFDGVPEQLLQMKEDFNKTVNHVEHDLRKDIDSTWEIAVRNEQFSRKNNIRLLGLEEEPDEHLEAKFIACMQDNLGEEVKPEEIG